MGCCVDIAQFLRARDGRKEQRADDMINIRYASLQIVGMRSEMCTDESERPSVPRVERQ